MFLCELKYRNGIFIQTYIVAHGEHTINIGQIGLDPEDASSEIL